MTWFSRLAHAVSDWPAAFAFILLVALAALRIRRSDSIQELRVRVFDLFQVMHPREATQRPVVIVDIDEKVSRPSASGRGRARASPISLPV